MARLNKTDSGAVFALMEHKGWESLMKLVVTTIAELNSREAPGQNAYEKLRSVFVKEGQVKGLTEFFKGVEEGTALTERPNVQ